MVSLVSCRGRYGSRDASLEHANLAFVHGELKQSQDEADRGYQKFRGSTPELAWKFRILEAKAALWRGLFEDSLKLLRSEPLPFGQPDLAIPILTLVGAASVNTHNFSDAKRALDDAARLCAMYAAISCGDLLQTRGLLASEQGDSDSAETFYALSLSFARAHGDLFLESTSLLNLGTESLAQGRFDQAIDRSEAAYRVATALEARVTELVIQGNIGWARYKLGDADKALGLFLDAEKNARELGDVVDQGIWLTNAGYVHLDDRNLSLAEQSFRRALEIEEAVNSQENIYNALRALARLSLQTGDGAKANEYSEQALAIARKSGNRLDELYPLLVMGQVSALRGDNKTAESTFREVERDKLCPVFLKWEAEHSLAHLYEDEKHSDAADREYRAALATFEAARDNVRHEDFQLSFLTNAARIYDDYIHFLVTQGKTDEALRWADYSRARTLAEGLGLLTKGASPGPPPLNPRQIARQGNGTVLFYWLGEKQSYLWAITARKTSLFTLPPSSEIDAAVSRYRRALGGLQDVLDAGDPDGQALYRMLVAPAQAMFGAAGAKVFVIPDGSLNNLNFETLLVPTTEAAEAKMSARRLSEIKLPEAKPSKPKLHYWIEDVTIANASSLRVLGARPADLNTRRSAERSTPKTKRDRSLLLVGNSIAAGDRFPELPKAALQMENVARHFPADRQQILSRGAATPSAYLASNPEKFSYLHFVAHGTASRLSPLDSAIILSKTGLSKTGLAKTSAATTGVPQTPTSQTPLLETSSPENGADDSFKLYARDIIRHPLHADLVTISACHGADGRAYSGEGLVGLSWAFIRAGAHNVVAALWEVTDVSTPQLMDQFYDEMDKGAPPAAALRAAKLQMLRSTGFRNPYYWAPFQLYAGS